MKARSFIWFVLFIISSNVVAQNGLTTMKPKLKVFTNTRQFYDPGIGNYLEFQVQFASYSLTYLPVEGGGKQAKVMIEVVFEKNGAIAAFDKYELKSPIMKDDFVEDFFDVQRFALAPGDYSMFIKLVDMYGEYPSIEATQQIVIRDRSKGACFSEIKEAEMIKETKLENNFTKSGFYILPKIGTKYEPENTKLITYLELYGNKSTDSSFTVRQIVVDDARGEPIKSLTKETIVKNTPVTPLIRFADLTYLESGSYFLYFELLNQQDSVIAFAGIPFSKKSGEIETNKLSYTDVILDPAFVQSIPKDSAIYYLESLMPIVKQGEQRNILTMAKTNNSDAAIKYLQAFWKQTGGADAYEAWLKYKVVVDEVEEIYGRRKFMPGYASDRGRVILQYGLPSSKIIREQNVSEYPYEIWQYDKIGKYSNRRFVFYNPDIIDKNYVLLHSDMFGEPNNYRWPNILNKRNSSIGEIDDPSGGTNDHFGGNSGILYQTY